MPTPTIFDIKYLTQEKAPYFFSRGALKHFGQTMKDFRVRTSPNGRIFIYAPICLERKVIGYTFREFTGNDLVSVPEVSTHFAPAAVLLASIHSYIETH